MGAEKIKRYLTKDQLITEMFPSWSIRKLERRMKDDGFPYIKDGHAVLFDVDDVQLWIKQRKQNV